jgi:serine/threonine-protein kinase RsbW
MTPTTAHPTGARRTPQPPLLSHLELPCHPTAVARARHHAHAVLGEWRVPDRVRDTALLLISELATNAVTHTGPRPRAAGPRPGPPGHEPPHARPPGPEDLPDGEELPCIQPHFMLTLWGLPERLLIHLYDQDRTVPTPYLPDLDSEHGRGLLLVDALSDNWGWQLPEPGIGKVVWAELRLRPEDEDPAP